MISQFPRSSGHRTFSEKALRSVAVTLVIDRRGDVHLGGGSPVLPPHLVRIIDPDQRDRGDDRRRARPVVAAGRLNGAGGASSDGWAAAGFAPGASSAQASTQTIGRMRRTAFIVISYGVLGAHRVRDVMRTSGPGTLRGRANAGPPGSPRAGQVPVQRAPGRPAPESAGSRRARMRTSASATGDFTAPRTGAGARAPSRGAASGRRR